MVKTTLAMLVAMLLLAAWVKADTVVLKNGTSVEGSVIKFGSEYRVKVADGTTKIIPESDVASVGHGTTAAGGPTVAVSGNFAQTKARAENVDAPVLAVTIWEKYIDANSSSPDLPVAKTELAKWQKLNADRAERINGKWVGGEERKKLLYEVARLCTEARAQLENQTLQAVEKYEKAVKLYPNCFEANFALGYYYLSKGAIGPNGRGSLPDLDKAIKSLEVAVKLRPNSPSALSNLAVGYNFRQRYEDAVLTAFKAAKIEDNKAIVENLVNCLAFSPPGLQANNTKVRAILPEAAVLARKYNITPKGTGAFHYIPPEPPGSIPKDDSIDKDQGPPGIIGNGSGFLVSADGYIITNRHVVQDKNRLFRVRFDDGTEKQADVIAIDDKNDIALIKVKVDKPTPFLKLAESDLPNPGAQCMVLGYPIASLLDFKMQVTSGQISSTDEAEPYQVTLTANTTHGNSGGPIVDRDGNVIGILSAAMIFENTTYLKAISAGQIRAFLDRVKDKQPPTVQSSKPADTAFNGEQLAKDTRKATLMVLIIRGDGKEAAGE